jgi:hypothetical protein
MSQLDLALHAGFSARHVSFIETGRSQPSMTLGTPRDVTLQELRIETFFPADDASEKTWTRMTADGAFQ